MSLFKPEPVAAVRLSGLFQRLPRAALPIHSQGAPKPARMPAPARNSAEPGVIPVPRPQGRLDAPNHTFELLR